MMALPVIASITVFCWSTGVVPTAIVTTLMLCANLLLVVWDVDRWMPILRRADRPSRGGRKVAAHPAQPLIDLSLCAPAALPSSSPTASACLAYGGV